MQSWEVFSGPPLPLAPELPLQWLSRQLQATAVLGAWVREATHPLQLHYFSKGRLLVSRDLGLLLGRCRRVALREGAEPVVLEADQLIQWRALQVVTATPYLPGIERLNQIFPGAHLSPTGFQVPIRERAPEDVLADCLTHGIEVAGSRIVYDARRELPARLPVDAAPQAPLR